MGKKSKRRGGKKGSCEIPPRVPSSSSSRGGSNGVNGFAPAREVSAERPTVSTQLSDKIVSVPSLSDVFTALPAIISGSSPHLIPLKGITSTNDDPTLCDHCSTPFSEGFLDEISTIHSYCGVRTCSCCYASHIASCVTVQSTADALSLLRVRANAGTPWAQYSLARFYRLAGSLNIKEEILWMKRAADQGHPDACFHLSLSYLFGEGCDRCFVAAQKYLERAVVINPRDLLSRSSRFLVTLAACRNVEDATSMLMPLAFLGVERARELLGRISPSVTEELKAMEEYRQSSLRALEDYLARYLTPAALSQFVEAQNRFNESFRTSSDNSSDSSIFPGFKKMFGAVVAMLNSPSFGQQSLASTPADVEVDALSRPNVEGVDALFQSEEALTMLLLTCWTMEWTMEHHSPGDVDGEIIAFTNFIANNLEIAMDLRSMAMTVQANMYCGSHPAKYLFDPMREAILRRRSCAFAHEATESGLWDTACPLKVYICQTLKESSDRLSLLEGPADSQVSICAEDVSTKEVVTYAKSVGGGYCDECGKTPAEAGMANLFKCSSCRLAYYCSKECFSAAWSKGHRDHCKKFGCFQEGDCVVVQCLDKDSTLKHLNGCIGSVLGRAESGGWQVDVAGETVPFTLRTKNLRHQRPLA